MNARHILFELFDAALRAVNGRVCVASALRAAPVALPVDVFAIGKAASSMALGARDALGDGIRRMLVITKEGHADPTLAAREIVQLESSHPVPDARSLIHGAQLERCLSELPPEILPIFLVSGGSSSLVESLRDGKSLQDLRALNELGLASGWDIRTLNQKRAALSRLKGGGVARLLDGRPALALFISDVPGDDTDVIGAGLLGRDAGGCDAVTRRIVANVEAAAEAASRAAHSHGLELERRDARFDGDAVDVARDFVAALRDSAADGVVWGGESTVTLPARTGRGGRNTHLALAAARMLRADEGVMILAAGTDGTDGPTEDAGAIVDAGTIGRAELGGVDVERAFDEFDSGTALEAAGDLLHTGPTGTNVGDLLIGIRRSAASPRDALSGRVL